MGEGSALDRYSMLWQQWAVLLAGICGFHQKEMQGQRERALSGGFCCKLVLAASKVGRADSKKSDSLAAGGRGY